MSFLLLSQAQVAGYTDDDLPEVFLFRSISKDVSCTENFYHVLLRSFLTIQILFVSECNVHQPGTVRTQFSRMGAASRAGGVNSQKQRK